MNAPTVDHVHVSFASVITLELSDSTYTFFTRNLYEVDTPSRIIGRTWLYNAYDPHTRTLSIHTSGPTLTFTCELVRVSKAIVRDVTHEYIKGEYHA